MCHCHYLTELNVWCNFLNYVYNTYLYYIIYNIIVRTRGKVNIRIAFTINDHITVNYNYYIYIILLILLLHCLLLLLLLLHQFLITYYYYYYCYLEFCNLYYTIIYYYYPHICPLPVLSGIEPSWWMPVKWIDQSFICNNLGLAVWDN